MNKTPDPDIIVDSVNSIIFIPLRDKSDTIIDYAKADLEDYDKLKNIRFHKHIGRRGNVYAEGEVNGKSVKMHTLIYGKAPHGFLIDHKDSDGLDNRKAKLRYATKSQNAQNRIKEQGKYSSDYSGVSVQDDFYRAIIQYQGKTISIGSYQSEIEAAKAYDIYAIHYYGKDAKTNKILTEMEIDYILKNGIPVEYQKIVRDLPKNITYKNGKYICSVQRNKKRISKGGINTLEEAIKIKEEMIERLENEMKEQNPINTVITKNNEGNSIISLKNSDGNIVAETIVDENLWLELSQYSWYLNSDGYVMGYPDIGHISLHTYLHKRYIGDIPDHLTVDHKDQNPLNNKLENLRLKSRSFQVHNQKKRENTTCHYRGVSISYNKFSVLFDNIRYSFIYAEDAARKYNELAKEKFGEDACQNIVPDTKTTVTDYAPKNITVEYIKNIVTIENFKMLVRCKGWGGLNGHFKLSKIKLRDLEEHKKKAIEILLIEEPFLCTENTDNNEQKLVNKRSTNITDKICKYKGVFIKRNIFIANYNGERYSFDYIEDAARKYNELLIADKGDNVDISELNVIPDTRSKVSDVIPDIVTIEEVKNIRLTSLLQQIVRKKGWGGGKPFKLGQMNMKTFEDDKTKLIELLKAEQLATDA